MHDILDAPSYDQGELARNKLANTLGVGHWPSFCSRSWTPRSRVHSGMHLMDDHQGLVRVSPEWCWRDFRQRLSRGRHHGSGQRLERAALAWAIYRNLTPAQRRSEHR